MNMVEDQCRKCSWYNRVRCTGGARGTMYTPGMFGCGTFRKYESHFAQSLNPPWDERLEDKMMEAAIEKFEDEEASREGPRW